MKITLFTHNAVIGVDAPLCHKNPAYVQDLIDRGEAEMLPTGSFRRPAARLRQPRGYSVEKNNEVLMAAAHETAANTAISFRECEANVGIAKTEGAVLRAQHKIKAWMSKGTEDERSPLPRGKWADFRSLEPVVLQ